MKNFAIILKFFCLQGVLLFMEPDTDKKIRCEIDVHNNIVILFYINMYMFPLSYCIFGSWSSQDYDVILWLPHEIPVSSFPHEVLNKICELLDKQMELILCKDIQSRKPINSCLGQLSLFVKDDTEMKDNDIYVTWSQKGHEEMVNNSIAQTFDHHRDSGKQMFSSCPINRKLKVNFFKKYVVTAREILCKLAGVKFNNHMHLSTTFQFVIDQTVDFLFNVLQIEEIRFQEPKKLKEFLTNMLQTPFIVKKVYDKLPEKIRKGNTHLSSLVGSPENKLKKSIIIGNLVDTMTHRVEGESLEFWRNRLKQQLYDIVFQNYQDRQVIKFVIDFYKRDDYDLKEEVIQRLTQSLNQGNICLDNILSHCRRNVGATIGVRASVLSLIDFSKIDFFGKHVRCFAAKAYNLKTC